MQCLSAYRTNFAVAFLSPRNDECLLAQKRCKITVIVENSIHEDIFAQRSEEDYITFP